jgi:hypothetical protein
MKPGPGVLALAGSQAGMEMGINMQDDPLIEQLRAERQLEEVQERRFQANWNSWIICLALIIAGFLWMFFHTHLRREGELPNRPLTKADLPLLRKKVKSLKADAGRVSALFPHLRNKAEVQTLEGVLKEVCFSPELYPAIVQVKNVEMARFAGSRPDLVEGMRIAREFEDGRFDIANNTAVTDKAAAVATLEKRLGSARKSAQYTHYSKEYSAARKELIGDPEFDRANQACQKILNEIILKRRPELAEYLHEEELYNAACHEFLAQANALSRKIKALEGGTEPARPAAAKSDDTTPAAVSRAGDAGNVNVPTNRPDTAVAQQAPAGPAPPALPEYAVRYGVKVGDDVEISALKPMIAFRHALITRMDNDQLKVRIGEDSYIVRWKDLTHLRANDGK